MNSLGRSIAAASCAGVALCSPARSNDEPSAEKAGRVVRTLKKSDEILGRSKDVLSLMRFQTAKLNGTASVAESEAAAEKIGKQVGDASNKVAILSGGVAGGAINAVYASNLLPIVKQEGSVIARGNSILEQLLDATRTGHVDTDTIAKLDKDNRAYIADSANFEPQYASFMDTVAAVAGSLSGSLEKGSNRLVEGSLDYLGYALNALSAPSGSNSRAATNSGVLGSQKVPRSEPAPAIEKEQPQLLSVVKPSTKWMYRDFVRPEGSHNACDIGISAEHPEQDIFKLFANSGSGYRCQEPVKVKMSDTEYIFKQACTASGQGMITFNMNMSLYVALVDNDHIKIVQGYSSPEYANSQETTSKGEFMRCDQDGQPPKQ